MAIERKHVGPRMSQIVIRGDTIYLAGQVAADAPGASIADQTRNIVDKIDAYLAEAGTDKSRLLTATVWLSDIGDYDEMNSVWDAWIDPANPPARACIEAKLAAPQYNVEIMVVAAR